MLTEPLAPKGSLRVLCLEDNPLIVLHLQQMIEDMGHRFVRAFESFEEMRDEVEITTIDCVLIDIDLTDGRTGPQAAAWFRERGVPALFVTGQERLAREHGESVLGIVPKPVSTEVLRAGLDSVAATVRPSD